MNIKSLATKIMIGTSMFAKTDCREIIHEVQKSPKLPIVELVDSFVKTPLNKVETTGMNLFEIDTLEISEKLIKTPQKFIKHAKNIAKSKIPEEKTEGKIVYGLGIKFNGEFGTGYILRTKSVPKYDQKSIQVQVQNKVYANQDSTKFFVPVEYYGK